jgi:alkylation response protein AidB-like acyl-CoA dehydrogenase
MLLAAQAKVFTSENAIQVVNDALQFFGARGYSRELPLERMARDVRMFTIGGGTARCCATSWRRAPQEEAAADARRLEDYCLSRNCSALDERPQREAGTARFST